HTRFSRDWSSDVCSFRSSPNSDWWKLFYYIISVVFECCIRNRITERNCRHIKAHGYKHHRYKYRRCFDKSERKECYSVKDMKHSVEFFSIDPTVCNDSSKGGHKDGGKSHGCKYKSELCSVPTFGSEPKISNSNKPGSPHKKLQETHYSKAGFYCHLICKVFRLYVSTMTVNY